MDGAIGRSCERGLGSQRQQQAARKAARKAAREGDWRRAARLQRACLEVEGEADRTWELRNRYLLLRWSSLAGDWSEVLDEADRIYELLSERTGRLHGALDWLAVIQCVARFESGWGDRFRRSLARILRRTRGSQDSRVARVAAALHRSYRAARSPGQCLRSKRVSCEVVLGEVGSGDGAGREPRGYLRAISSVSLLGWADEGTDLLALEGMGPEELTEVWRELMEHLKLSPESAGEGTKHDGVSADVVRALRAVLALAVEVVEVDGRKIRRRLLRVAATPTRPCLVRALALRVAAELGISGLEAGDPLRSRRLARFRNELGMAAGLFHGLGLNEPAQECEERWASLHPSLSRLTAVLSAQGLDRKLVGARAPRSLEDVRARCQLAGFRTGDVATLRACARMLLLAPTPLPVLIRGESGTGKEVMARALHEWSGVDGEFVAIHCGAIPRELLESELFGHSRGAFTGASADKPGLIEVADGGTLFLDEIGEMSAEAQMKLLRVLESGEVRRVGDVRTRQVRVRIVAATHRDLESAVETGDFRLDLLHRIGSVVVVIPPLRSRRGDIPLLVRTLLQQVAPDLGLSESALGAVFTHEWPGNVRELRATVLRSAYLAQAIGVGLITEDLLGLAGADSVPAEVDLPLENPVSEDESSEPSCEIVESMGLERVLESMERRLIVRALEHSDWNRAQAARSLGGLSRTTLVSKMKRLGIDRATPLKPAGDLAPTG